MLARLDFKRFAYDWRPNNIPQFGDEIRALQRHGIELYAWWFPFDANDPAARSTLELLKTHKMTPWLWVPHASPGETSFSELVAEAAKFLPAGLTMPASPQAFEALSGRAQYLVRKAIVLASEVAHARSRPNTPEAQAERVRKEAANLLTLHNLAASYGMKIALYNHNGWFGDMENQLAMLRHLEKEHGLRDIGIVYNFSHARDAAHDDTRNFKAVWKKIQPYVVTVNVAGTHREDGTTLLPSQGDRELEMMRIIEGSGWTGPIGLLAESGGDAERTLADARRGLEWLAAEIDAPGAGGARPVFDDPTRAD